MSIVHKIEAFFPTSWVEKWRLFKRYTIKHRSYAKKINELQKVNRPIRVCFLALDASVWKYNSLYRLMESDSVFEPIVLVCPIVNAGREIMLHKMSICYKDFKNRGYNVLKSYDEATDTYIPLTSISPDIIFYTNPYRGLIEDRYYINHINGPLTCYLNYGFGMVPYKWAYCTPLHQLVWTYFCETHYHQSKVLNFSKPLSPNIYVSGYPMYDEFIDNNKDICNIWKLHDRSLKRVIWAPHHSIFDIVENDEDVEVKWSTFLLYSDKMVQLAQKYANKVQFVFKPHPVLKQNLYKHKDWGKAKTDAYYNLWESMPNTTLSEANYVDLFSTSDAIIHDCGSFTVEYLYTRKPCMWLSTYADIDRFNHVGIDAFNCYYKGLSISDVENFILRVIAEEDPMYETRETFVNRYLRPFNNLTVGQNIVAYLKGQLNK